MDPFIAYLLIKNLENKKEKKIKYPVKNIQKNNDQYNKINNYCTYCGQYPIWCRCVLK
jgi:hypothetical protein